MKNPDPKSTKTGVLLLTSVASFMISLDSQVVMTALGAIRLNLGASMEALEWAVNAYILSFAVLLPAGAALGDRLGRRRVFLIGIAVFVAASAACALAHTIGWLIAARAVQGAGGALVMPLAMALLSAAFPREERGKALGTFTGITGLALLAGPTIGGAVAEGLAWQWIFWINVPVGLVLIPLARRRITESFGTDTRLDIIGIVLATGASIGVAWGLMRGNSGGWTSTEVTAALIGGVLLTIAFVVWERRTREPMVPMRLFQNRAFAAGIAASVPYYAAIYGTLFFLVQFLQTAQGYGPFGAGLRVLPWTATLFIIAPLAGRIMNRVGERPLILLGLLLQTIGMAWIALTASPDLSFVGLALPLVVAGCGGSMAMPALQNAVMSAVAPSDIGKASGTFNMLRFLGGMLGIALLVAVFAENGTLASPQGFSNGFAAAIGASATLSLLGLIVGLSLPARRGVALKPAHNPAE
jgi:EmrB/QacA subfamily drug resistance transporter